MKNIKTTLTFYWNMHRGAGVIFYE